MSFEGTRHDLLVRYVIGRALHGGIEATAKVLDAVGDVLQEVGHACFAIEADAARRYQDLTGVDLAALMGDEDAEVRYSDDADAVRRFNEGGEE